MVVVMQNSISAPSSFEFDIPEKLSQWLIRFHRYMTFSKLAREGDATKHDTLLYCLGAESEEVFRTFEMTADNANDYISSQKSIC